MEMDVDNTNSRIDRNTGSVTISPQLDGVTEENDE